ncbi:MAG: precorrin-8X methylmutase [Oscillospiraceae bacterium]|nr:precorrin-8X methylmutase [Oscillospiraceae bacterium]
MKGTQNYRLPAEIEQASMDIISEELSQRGVVLPPEAEAVVKRVIHTTADFDYVDTLRFTPSTVQRAVAALRMGTAIVTDTAMAQAGISKSALQKLSCEAHCLIAEPQIAQAAKEQGTTRAAAAMQAAAQRYPEGIFAVGNAPTALLALCDLVQSGLRPALIIGVPVGFVHVEESKQQLYTLCQTYGLPCIAAMGRKGGSNVAAAVCNALLYTALDALDPALRQRWSG